MPVWTGAAAQCFWSYHTGARDKDGWNGFVADLASFLKQAAPGCVALTITCKTPPPGALERARIKSVLASKDAEKLRAHAFVTDSVVLRGTLTALDWVLKKPYTEKVFASPREAFEWLAAVQPSLPIDIVRQSYLDKVPAHAQW